MHDADDLVAVMQSFEHVDEEVQPLPICQAMAHQVLSKASVRVVLSDKVDCAARVGDHLVKPDDVRVVKVLGDLDLAHDSDLSQRSIAVERK